MASDNGGETMPPDRSEEGTDGLDGAEAVVQLPDLPLDLDERSGNDRILAAYYNSQWLVERATNVIAPSCPTLRNFLKRVTPELPADTAQHFTELTMITEMVMYSIPEQDEETVTRSCLLAEEIRRQLHRHAMHSTQPESAQ